MAYTERYLNSGDLSQTSKQDFELLTWYLLYDNKHITIGTKIFIH